MSVKSSLAIAATAVVALTVLGCTDTTEAPKSTVTEANIFQDPNSYEALLAKVYTGLAIGGQQGGDGSPDIQGIDAGFSQYLRLFWETEELPTDAAVIAWGDIGLPEMNTMTWTAQSNMVVAMYYRIFFQVTMANQFLRETTDDQLAAHNVSVSLKAQIQTWRAEARFLRALSYWHGIDLFGSIPLVTESDPIGGAPPKQVTRDSLFNYVVSELNAIKAQLPAPGPSTYGRANTAAASMLLAELYLNAEVYTGAPQWGAALSAAQEVINSGAFQLDPNWRHMFEADNNTSPEIIFAVPQDGNHTQTYGGVNFLVHAECGGSMNNGTYGVDGCWYGIRLKQEMYHLFATGDQRASYFWTAGQTVDVTNISDFSTGIPAPKFTNVKSTGGSGSNPGFVDTDFPMFRLSGAYLIYAEAFLRGGGGTQAQALAYVNAIRERAFGGTAGDITAAQLTLPFILDERGRELMWEAHRRTDLVRFGEFTGGSYIWQWKGGTHAGMATDAHYNVYPLPASELVANPNLKQNPGY
jgi:hypothetical protein